MSKRPEPGWSLWCDWPGCGYQFEYAEYTIFGDGWDLEEIVTDADGRVSRDRTKHYCHLHLCVWASDHEDGDPFTQPPYLLIHDGDTGNPADDGFVTLITASD